MHCFTPHGCQLRKPERVVMQDVQSRVKPDYSRAQKSTSQQADRQCIYFRRSPCDSAIPTRIICTSRNPGMSRTGRVGSAFAAELGTMAVSEQTDSLRVLGSDPVDYLITPRTLACMIAGPILNLMCFVMGEFLLKVHMQHTVLSTTLFKTCQAPSCMQLMPSQCLIA